MVSPEEVSTPHPDTRADAPTLTEELEVPENKIAYVELGQLPIGARLIVRSKKDWRFAAVSRFVEETVVLSICSPSGHTYRLRRGRDAGLSFDGAIPILLTDMVEEWRENFSAYDRRW